MLWKLKNAAKQKHEWMPTLLMNLSPPFIRGWEFYFQDSHVESGIPIVHASIHYASMTLFSYFFQGIWETMSFEV